MLSAESYLEALEAAETAIRFDPSNTMARNNKSIALLGLQNDSDALIAAEKAISLKSDNAVAWSNKGVALRKLARYDEDPEFKKLLR
jgi:tetratricopeptide (TPR) repeat protein